MKRIIFLVMAVLISAIIVCGCTGTDSKPVSDSQTSSQTQSSQASGFSLVPTATDSVPKNFGFAVDAEKDPLSGKVTVISRGGAGLYMAENLNVKIYLSTGEILEKNIAPDVNSQAVFTEGTKGTDRVVAVVSMQNGESYKIYDGLLEYRKRADNK